MKDWEHPKDWDCIWSIPNIWVAPFPALIKDLEHPKCWGCIWNIPDIWDFIFPCLSKGFGIGISFPASIKGFEHPGYLGDTFPCSHKGFGASQMLGLYLEHPRFWGCIIPCFDEGFGASQKIGISFPASVKSFEHPKDWDCIWSIPNIGISFPALRKSQHKDKCPTHVPSPNSGWLCPLQENTEIKMKNLGESLQNLRFWGISNSEADPGSAWNGIKNFREKKKGQSSQFDFFIFRIRLETQAGLVWKVLPINLGICVCSHRNLSLERKKKSLEEGKKTKQPTKKCTKLLG